MEADGRNLNYGRIETLSELLIQSAKNQLRQEKLITGMAAKIAALEEKLAEEKPVPLDKGRYRPPGKAPAAP